MTLEEFKTRFRKKPVVHFHHNVNLENVAVSVCVTTYQHKNYIIECLESILMQRTAFNYEIILGEDGSDDGTRDICINYAIKYPTKIRLLLHNRENNIKINGKSTGRFNFFYNLLNSKAKYIALCEGDDFWIDSSKLQKQYDAMEANPTINICGHPSKILNDKTQKFIGITTDFGSSETILTMQEIIISDHLAVIPMQSIFVKNYLPKNLFELTEHKIGVHGPLIIMYGHPSGLLCLPTAMSVYRKFSSSSISRAAVNNPMEYIQHRKNILATYYSLNEHFNYIYDDEFKSVLDKRSFAYISNGNLPFKYKFIFASQLNLDFSVELFFVSFVKRIKYLVKSIFRDYY